MPLVGLLGLGLVWLETRSLQACGLRRRSPLAWRGGARRGDLAAARLAALAWLSAAIGEELVFRGFLPHQLSTLIRRFRGASAVAAPLGAVAFGLMHAGQGASGIVPTGIVGSLFGCAYLHSGRHLGAMVLAHGLIDSWSVATLYLGRH